MRSMLIFLVGESEEDAQQKFKNTILQLVIALRDIGCDGVLR